MRRIQTWLEKLPKPLYVEKPIGFTDMMSLKQKTKSAGI